MLKAHCGPLGHNHAVGPLVTVELVVASRLTVPEKPKILLIVMVDEASAPTVMLRDAGLGARLNPATLTLHRLVCCKPRLSVTVK